MAEIEYGVNVPPNGENVSDENFETVEEARRYALGFLKDTPDLAYADITEFTFREDGSYDGKEVATVRRKDLEALTAEERAALDDEPPEKPGMWLVAQQGGSSTEWYVHLFDHRGDAETHVKSCKAHTYDACDPVAVPHALARYLRHNRAAEQAFMDALCQVVDQVVMEDFSKLEPPSCPTCADAYVDPEDGKCQGCGKRFKKLKEKTAAHS